MSIIERYMFRRIGMLALGALTVTTGIALTTQVLLRVDLLASTGQSLATIGQLALYLVPSMVAVALPFAVLIGILQTMRTMNQDSELVVLEASGSSITQRARPALTIGVIGTVICFVISIWIEPLAGQKIRELLARASGDLLSAAIQSGSFKQIDKGLFIQIAEKLPDGRFGGIFVSDARDETNQFTYIAKTGSILAEEGQTLLVVNDGEIQRKNIADGTITFIKFDTYSLDAGAFSSPGSIFLTARDRSTSYLLNPDINDPEFQRFPGRVGRELHRRFSDPLYSMALAFIAVYVTVTARSHRQGATAALTSAALLGFGVRAIGFVLAGAAGLGLFSILTLYLFPVMMIAVFAGLLVSGRQMQWLETFSEGMIEFSSRIVLNLRNLRRTR